MVENTINVSEEIIDWAINKVSTNDSLISILKEWKNSKKVLFNDVEIMSKEANIPIGYFFLKTPPKEELYILKFRTIKNKDFKNPSKNLKDTISTMESIQAWMKEYLIAENHEKLYFIGSIKDETSVQKIADKIRTCLGININWYTKSKDSWDSFKIIRNNLKKIGIITMLNGVVGQNNNRKLFIEEFRAFCLIDEFAPLIFINSNDSYEERLFSLLYEAVFIWRGCNCFFNDRKIGTHSFTPEEKICYEVCLEILMPNEIFIEKWTNIEEISIEDKIKYLSKEFKCSNIAVCRKAFNNKYLDYNFFKDLVDLQYDNVKNIKKPKRGHYYNIAKSRYDNKFLLALYNNIKKGKASFGDVYKFTNININPFLKLIEKIK